MESVADGRLDALMPAVQWMARQVTSEDFAVDPKESRGSPSPWSPDEFVVNLAMPSDLTVVNPKTFGSP